MEENTHDIPHNTSAERSLLGCMLLSAKAVELAMESLGADDFFSVAHRDIFTAMQKLFETGKSIDAVTVMDMLDKQGKTESSGGSVYLGELMVDAAVTGNEKQYIEIIASNSIRRKLITVGSSIAHDASESTRETSSILENAERQIYNIAMRRTQDSMERIGTIYSRVYDQIGELIQLQGKRTGIATGLSVLDDLTSGLQRSDLVIVAGRPSSGKSAFAFGIAAHAAIREKANVAIFSLEMSKEQIVMRIMSGETGINMQKLRTGELGATEILRIADRFNTVGESNIMIDDTPGMTVAEIRTKCRRLQAMHGLDIIVIDYLQLMQSATKRDSRVLEVAEMTRGLKMLARELNIVVILLSQLSRAVEGRNDKRPMLSDLRESGSIEQDADIVLFLYRDAYYNKESTRQNVSECIVAKNRHGEVGTVELIWDGQFTRFSNMDTSTPPEG